MSDLPFDPATAFGAVFSDGAEWPWLFLATRVMPLHLWSAGRDLAGQIVIEKAGDFDSGPEPGRTLLRADLGAALAVFPAWRPA